MANMSNMNRVPDVGRCQPRKLDSTVSLSSKIVSECTGPLVKQLRYCPRAPRRLLASEARILYTYLEFLQQTVGILKNQL